jgi:hypothetical protein
MTLALTIIIGLGLGCSGGSEEPAPSAGGGSSEAAISGEGVTGQISGTRVALTNSTFDGELAIFEEDGWGWSPSLLIFLFLDDNEVPEGRTFTVRPDDGFQAGAPHVHYRWREPGSDSIKVDSVMKGYRLDLRFGNVSDGALPGEIELSVPGTDTDVSGTFVATME